MPVPKEGKMAALAMCLVQDAPSGLKVRLAQAFAAVADDEMTLGDITECDFVGYAEIAAGGWDSPTINAEDRAHVLSPLLTWTAGDLLDPQTIVGVYLVAEFAFSPNTRLLWFKKLTPTVTLAAEDEEFSRKIDLLGDELVL